VIVLFLRIVFFGGSCASCLYTIFALVRVMTFRSRRPGAPYRPSVTVAKPFCGADAGLAENLRSFLEQQYPSYQIVLGVRHEDDAAVPILREMLHRHPNVDAALNVGFCENTPNLKLANLVSMSRLANHDILVISDSDIRVSPDYLGSVVAPFEDPAVAAVTCLYVAEPSAGPASRLGAMYTNYEFLPSILVALALQPLAFCFGPTMAVRRESLDALGGFAALGQYLADDYMLGHWLHARGDRVELASCVVRNILYEPELKSLFQHELRWARTIRAVRPWGYGFSVLTMALPWAVAALAASAFSPAGWCAVAIAFTLRAALQVAVNRRFDLPEAARPHWIPVRDFLTFAVYCASHLGRRVSWRGITFTVASDGRLQREGGEA
jgi:ceramide glucosyltransferase